MALRKFVDRLTKPTEQIDREHLEEWCTISGLPALDDVEVRKPVRVAGEVRSIRIVPRAGADALEATITDGHGVAHRGVPRAAQDPRHLARPARLPRRRRHQRRPARQVMYNPVYELA